MYQAVRLPREAIIVVTIYDLNYLVEQENQGSLYDQLLSLSGHLTGAVYSIIDVSDSKGAVENVAIAVELLHEAGHAAMVAGADAVSMLPDNIGVYADVDSAIDDARSFLADELSQRSA